MNLKNCLLIVGLLLVGVTIAQEETPPIRVVASPPPPMPAGTVGVDPNEIVEFPIVDAEFPGGVKAMKAFIQDNVYYPEKARENGDVGRVYVTFVVEKDGSITNVEVMRRGLTPELNAEAKRLVRAMPPWKPGEISGGEVVRCRCRLPITFILSGPDRK